LCAASNVWDRFGMAAWATVHESMKENEEDEKEKRSA
jgi:hypothetical protein